MSSMTMTPTETGWIRRAYEPVDMIELMDDPAERAVWMSATCRQWATDNAIAGPAATVTDEAGRVLGCGGLRVYWPGVADAWAVFRRQTLWTYPKTSFRTIRAILEDLTEKEGIVRLQCFVRCDFPAAIRLAEHLGFDREGRMRKFSHDEHKDCFLYAKIFEGD